MGNHPLHHPLLYCALPRRLPLLLPGKFETVKDLNMRNLNWEFSTIITFEPLSTILLLQNYAAMKMVGPFGPAKAAE